MCRYKWHSADSTGCIFQIKYTEAILSNSTRKLLRFEINKMLIAVKKNKFIVLFMVIFVTVSFIILFCSHCRRLRNFVCV